jgi:CRISPR/Cas system CSM-associated protein Csm3 (group 7 of RAMP superfamily)
MELELPEDETLQSMLLQGLAIALSGFENREIGMGARKRRGFGECQITNWSVETYDLKQPEELLNWIAGKPGKQSTGATVVEKLGNKGPLPDHRKRFRLEAEFKLRTSLMIRSGGDQAEAPDMVYLHSKRGDDNKPILSGTSLAGAMRARGYKIANTLFNDPSIAGEFVETIFGPEKIKKRLERTEDDEPPFASRLQVREREVEGRTDLVQSRIRIDRLTGGTYPGALFEQQPVVGGDHSRVVVSVELRNPEDSQIGLLLHILRDLWSGDLPLGGESSTGRGRLEGIKADLYFNQPEKPTEEWHIMDAGHKKIKVDGDQTRLNTFARNVGGAR